MIAVVVAIDENHGIGFQGQIPWKIKEDLKYFRELTSGGTIIMGRKTYESIGRPLPNRRNIVISKSITWTVPGIEVFSTIESAISASSMNEKVFIIGGGEIYNQTIGIADELYITHVSGKYEADAFFPEIDEKVWCEVERKSVPRGEVFELPFDFVKYEMIK